MCLGISTFQNKDDTVKVSKDTMATHETSITLNHINSLSNPSQGEADQRDRKP